MPREPRQITEQDVDQFLRDLARRHPELKDEINKAIVADARDEFIFARTTTENQQ